MFNAMIALARFQSTFIATPEESMTAFHSIDKKKNTRLNRHLPPRLPSSLFLLLLILILVVVIIIIIVVAVKRPASGTDDDDETR